jgi:hypothetical protein
MNLKPIRVLVLAAAVGAAALSSGQALAQAPEQPPAAAPAAVTGTPPALEPTGGATNSVQESAELGLGGHRLARAAAITVGVVAIAVAFILGADDNGHTSAPTATR